MDKLKRTFRGIINMPDLSAKILSKCVLCCCLLVSVAIIITVIAQSVTYEPFDFIEKADLLMRVSPAVLSYGVIRSLSSVVQYKK